MNGSQLHRLARQLREIALATTGNTGEDALSAGELAIVEDVAAHPESAVGEIAARTRLAQSMVSKTMAILRDAGIFVVRRDPTDRRRQLVSIEPTARLQLFRDRGARAIDGELSKALAHRSPEEIARAISLLEEVAALLAEQADRRRD